MASFNRVILAGNLTRDVELQYTPSGLATTRLGLAVNHKWKDKNTGQIREEVTFVDCVAWSKTAELAQQYLNKGAPVLIEGRLKLEVWIDKQTNQKRQKLVVVVEHLQFLNRRAPADGQAADQAGQQPAGAPAEPAASGQGQGQQRLPNRPYPRSSPGMAAANAGAAPASGDPPEPGSEDLDIPDENIPF